MQQPLQSILQHLFQVTSLEEVSRQRLESFVEEYPSFGIGHYLLSRKLRTEDPGRFGETAQRTCLYFSNPFWLQWQLGNGATYNAQPHAAIPVEEPATDASPAAPEAPLSDEPEHLPAEPAEPTASDEPTASTEPDVPAEPAAESAAEELLRNLEEAKELRESLLKINEDIATVPVNRDEPIRDVETPFVLDEPEESRIPAPAAVSPEPAPPELSTVPPEPAPTPTAPEPATPGPDLVFEPYHTIDYFASQGIRLTMEENPGDALGKQLKSFTEWLKVMRKLPQKDRESAVPDRMAEQAIQSFAAHSIQSKDILTETMAEVLIKQGMHDRARAIYEKLSLLNPDKKAYFAAKIEHLNIP